MRGLVKNIDAPDPYAKYNMDKMKISNHLLTRGNENIDEKQPYALEAMKVFQVSSISDQRIIALPNLSFN